MLVKSILIICLLLFFVGVLMFAGQSVFGLGPEEQQPPSKQMRTLKFSIFQNPAVLVNGNSTTTPFDVFIGEQSPIIKDAYIEIKGVAQEATSQITADIRSTSAAVCDEAFATSRGKTFNIDSTGQSNHFQILYAGNGTSTVSSLVYCLGQIIQSPGTYSFELKTGVSGADVSALQARMVITYQFTPPSAGNYPATGELISMVFDTSIEGAAYNSLMFKGTKPAGTKVRFQFSTSNNSSGPWSYLGGATCNSSDWYDVSAADSPVEITCAPANHNNQRYFRYKIQLCSLSDCLNAGSDTPSVTDAVVSWSP